MSALESLSPARQFALKHPPGSAASQVAFVHPLAPVAAGALLHVWRNILQSSQHPLAQPLAEAVRKARSANGQLVALMQSYKSNNASSAQLESMRIQTEAALKRLLAAHAQLNANLSSSQAENLQPELRSALWQTLDQVNGWVRIGQEFLKKLIPIRQGFAKKDDPNEHFSRVGSSSAASKKVLVPPSGEGGVRASAKSKSSESLDPNSSNQSGVAAGSARAIERKTQASPTKAHAIRLAEKWLDTHISALKREHPDPDVQRAIKKEYEGERRPLYIEALAEVVLEQLGENPNLTVEQLFACGTLCAGQCSRCLKFKMAEVQFGFENPGL